MFRAAQRAVTSLAAVATAAAVVAGAGIADSPPIGRLPAGPIATITTHRGQLVAFALPHRAGGRVWRIARAFNARVVSQTSEADVANNVVLVFKATGRGRTSVVFGLTRGETSKAFESRRFDVSVS